MRTRSCKTRVLFSSCVVHIHSLATAIERNILMHYSQMPIQVTPNRELLLTASMRTSKRLLASVCSHVHDVIRRPIESLITDLTTPDSPVFTYAVTGQSTARNATRRVGAGEGDPSGQKNRLGCDSPVALRKYAPGARVGSTRQTLTHVRSSALLAARAGSAVAAAFHFLF